MAAGEVVARPQGAVGPGERAGRHGHSGVGIEPQQDALGAGPSRYAPGSDPDRIASMRAKTWINLRT
jgi:hypothetical protein